MSKKGSLVNVGLGMTLGSHISPLSRNFIEKADVVFVGASNQLVEEWVKSMNKDVRSLQPFYSEGTSRMITYRKMVDAIMTEVRAGKNVCGAFYGHPGVFAWAPHETIRQCHKEGYKAHMEAGISAEDCLYADLGIDPGTRGCIHYEASQFMFRNKIIDPTTYLVLWQVGVAGDKSLAKFSVEAEYKQILVDLLLETYPESHKVTLYECAVLPIERARIEEINLIDIPQADISLKTTVVIKPCKETTNNNELLAKIAKLQKV
jgi:uncharacterized protein YabN with tetrapyrrole methylase and pyrophosphatase domain